MLLTIVYELLHMYFELNRYILNYIYNVTPGDYFAILSVLK